MDRIRHFSNYILIFIFPFIFSIDIDSQIYTKIIDSLKNEYAKCKYDTSKILILAELASETGNKYLAVKGLYWSRFLNYQKGNNRNILTLISFQKIKNGKDEINKILLNSIKINDTVAIINCYLKLKSWNEKYFSTMLFNKALTFCTGNYKLYSAIMYNYLGLLETDASKKLEFLNNAADICKQYNNLESKVILSDINLSLFLHYISKDDLKLACIYYLKIAELGEELGRSDLSSVYWNMRKMYFQINDYLNCLKFTKKLLKISNDTTIEEFQYLGKIFYLLKDYENSELITRRTLTRLDDYGKGRTFKSLLEKKVCKERLALIYINENRLNEALKLMSDYNIELDKSDVNQRKYFTEPDFFIKAIIENKNGNAKQSNTYALNYLKGTRDNDIKKTLYFIISKNYKKLNNFKQSYFYLEKYAVLQDSLCAISESQNLNSLIDGYEQKLLNAEIHLLKKEKQLAIKKDEQKLILNLGLTVGSVLLVLLLLVLYKSIKFQKKTNKMLSDQKRMKI